MLGRIQTLDPMITRRVLYCCATTTSKIQIGVQSDLILIFLINLEMTGFVSTFTIWLLMLGPSLKLLWEVKIKQWAHANW